MAFSEKAHVVGVYAPSTEVGENGAEYVRYVDGSHYHNLDYYISLGCCGASGILYVYKLASSTVANGSGTLVNCYTTRVLDGTMVAKSTDYADTWGSITAGSTDGTTYVNASSNKLIEVSVDLDAFGTEQSCSLYIAGGTQTAASVIAILSNPRYGGNSQVSVIADSTL